MIDFQGVRKSYGGRDILEDASFRVNGGERVGVVGPNGSGKSTLLALIADELSPDKGEIAIPSRLRIGYLRQQLGFFNDSEPLLSFASAASGELPAIQERIHLIEDELSSSPSDSKELLAELGRLQTSYEQLGGYEMKHRAEAALAGLGFSERDFQKGMGEFSGGWQMRASMARALLGEPDILLLDEPSNYLDTPAVEWLQRRLKSFEGTLLLISHDRFLLNSLTDCTLEVDGGSVTRYPGNYSDYVRERGERRRHAEAARVNNDRRREQLERNIERFRAKASKASQVQSWVKMLDRLEDVDVPQDLHFRGRIRIAEPPHSGVETVRLEGVSHSYDGSRWILQGVDFSARRGEKIGIVGYNGTGKTTLLKTLAGHLKPSEGKVCFGHKVVVGYQAQEFAEILPQEMSAFDIVKDASLGGMPSQRIRETLGSFGFSGDDAMKPCGVLSGGEKIRLCFARIFVNPPNLLILDEPTTHLDISAREALQQAVSEFKGTVCIVSHDVEFLRGAADFIVEMKPPGIVRHHGGYDYYRERAWSPQDTPAQTREQQSASPKEIRREKAMRRQELLKVRRKMEGKVSRLEGEIEEAEAERDSINSLLLSPDQSLDYASLNRRLKELGDNLERLTASWERAATELEPVLEEYGRLHGDDA